MTMENLTLKNLNTMLIPWAKACHQRSFDKGWWEEGYAKRNLGSLMLLIKSELVEAYEEYRKPHSVMNATYYENGKPEGVPVELADVIIRIGDLMASMAIRNQAELVWQEEWNTFASPMPEDFGEMLDNVIVYLGKCRDFYETNLHVGNDQVLLPEAFKMFARGLAKSAHMVFTIAEKLSIDLGAAVALKHEFNGTRPHRHGGKRA